MAGSPTQSTPPAQVTWSVTSQQEVTRADPTGRFVPGVLVGFRTTAGVDGTVFVPDSQFTPETVRAMVQARVQRLSAVGALQGQA